jgi:hypothetical protein
MLRASFRVLFLATALLILANVPAQAIFGVIAEPEHTKLLFTRFFAISNLSPSNGVLSAEFLKLSSNPAKGKGGTCFGDSGGPHLLGGTATILGITSFGSNGNCAGVAYSYRIDTAAALGFIGPFLTH